MSGESNKLVPSKGLKMLDVFPPEVESIIIEGMTHLYWFKPHLKKAIIGAGVDQSLCEELFLLKYPSGDTYSKRDILLELYKRLHSSEHRKRLEISRNFVRLLIFHENFVPQDAKHNPKEAERAALKLKEILREQNEKKAANTVVKNATSLSSKPKNILSFDELQQQFQSIYGLPAQKRGYAFEKFFPELLKASSIDVEGSFKIIGEQIDGAIKFDSHIYLVELKWEKMKAAHNALSSLYCKVEGKLEARGIFVSMEGYSNEILNSLPTGKSLRIILFDGVHLSNIVAGVYSFSDLMNYAIKEASMKGNIYPDRNLGYK